MLDSVLGVVGSFLLFLRVCPLTPFPANLLHLVMFPNLGLMVPFHEILASRC